MTNTPDLKIENGVLIGRDGDLFLAGGTHEIVEFILGRELPARTTQLLHDNIVRRQMLSQHYNSEFLQLVAPEKYMVQSENFPVPQPGHFASAYLAKRFDDLVYPVAELRAAKGGRAYSQTDSHWSLHGLIAIAGLVARRAGLNATSVDAVLEPVAASIKADGGSFVGDLGRKLSVQQGEPRLRFDTVFNHKTYENGMGHDFKKPINDGRLIVIESPDSATEQTLLIFGDSYIFHALNLLALFFRKIVFCRSRFFHEEIVMMVRPNLIISQMAERYMGSVASDMAAPPFMLVPYLLERPVAMDVNTALAFTRVLSAGRNFDPAVFGMRPQQIATTNN